MAKKRIVVRTNKADDPNKRGTPDNDTISLTQAHERRDWAKKFGCTEAELRTAVLMAGKSAKKVEQYLKKLKSK